MDADAPNAVSIAPGLSVPEGLLRFTYARSGGPGGQNVNKLNTKAVLSVDVDELAAYLGQRTERRLRRLASKQINSEGRLILSAEEHRGQRANRKACIDKLRGLIVQARARPRRRKPTRPTRGSKERRLKEKKHRGEIKRRRSGREF